MTAMYVLDRQDQKSEILAALGELKLGSNSSRADFLRGRELLQELKAQLFNYETSPEYQAIKKLMGQNFIGPEAYKDLLGVTDVGAVPELPSELTPELLESDCPFTTEKKIKETHRLVFVPNNIDGEDLTIKSLQSCVAGSKEKHGRGEVFYAPDWFQVQEFSNKALSQGEWVLVPMVDLPDSRRKNNAEQLTELEKFPEYRTAKALEMVTALVMNELKNHERRFSNLYGACEELTNSGRRVCVGRFSESGLDVDYWIDDRYSDVGRAVVRRFGN